MTKSPLEKALHSAKLHARADYPRESCGIIVNDAYIACDNIADHPDKHVEGDDDCTCQLCSFRISGSVIAKHGDDIQMIVHSHPNGPLFPSEMDTKQQLATGYPWAIIAISEDQCVEPLIWGGDTPMAPIIGRQFMHFTADCYTLIRDTFRLGKDELAKQGVPGWPYDPIDLPEFPRADGWWDKDDDFYQTEPEKIGFREISRGEAEPGDVFLTMVKSDRLNHGGVLVGDGLIMHHLPSRFSRKEPAGLWGRQAKRWLRWEGIK